jgi:hypothetical protein
VNDTTEARMREGVVPTTTSSWNTVPLNVLAAPCFVVRSAARMTGMVGSSF